MKNGTIDDVSFTNIIIEIVKGKLHTWWSQLAFNNRVGNVTFIQGVINKVSEREIIC